MNSYPECRTGVAALRPWPFGPPLRGRAPRRDADTRVAPNRGAPPHRQPASTRQGRQALVHVEGLSAPPQTHSVQR